MERLKELVRDELGGSLAAISELLIDLPPQLVRLPACFCVLNNVSYMLWTDKRLPKIRVIYCGQVQGVL